MEIVPLTNPGVNWLFSELKSNIVWRFGTDLGALKMAREEDFALFLMHLACFYWC